MTDDELLESCDLRGYIEDGNQFAKLPLIEIDLESVRDSSNQIVVGHTTIELDRVMGLKVKTMDLNYFYIKCGLYNATIESYDYEGRLIREYKARNNYRSYRKINQGLDSLVILMDKHFGNENKYVLASIEEAIRYTIKYLESEGV